MTEKEKNIPTIHNDIHISGCSRCGCKGWHACTGKPIIWSEEDKKRFKEALSKMFGWDNKKDED